jgi:hypothetical protein
MRLKSFFVLLLVLVFSTAALGQEQQTDSAAESLEKLRAQMLELLAKEDGLRTRAQQLDESLKPENIERSLAGVGSTKPEELRESRRRQLTIERDGVLAQLKILEASKLRLEAAIANAEALAYQQSAQPAPTAGNQMMAASTGWSYRWLLLGGGGAAALALAGGVLFYRRRIRIS